MVAALLLFVSLLIYPSLTLKLPSYMKACSRNDPKLNECAVRNGRAAIPHFVHGDPKYGVPDLDPFIIEELKIRQGSEQVGLSIVLTKFKLSGLRDFDFTSARTDLKKRHIEWDIKSKQGVVLSGPYKASGKVLLLPITGDGMANLTIKDVNATFKFDYNFEKKKGKDYMNVTKTDLVYTIGGAYFQLDNLFNGDKLLGENMNRFLNENWKELVTTFGPKVGAAMQSIFEKLFISICRLVPYDDIYPDTKV